MIISSFSHTYYYHDFIEESTLLVKRYPSILKKKILGYSHDNREICQLNFGTGNHIILLTAGVHGRESLNTHVLIKLLELYCMAYEKKESLCGYSIQEFARQYQIQMIPLANPDGYMCALRGFNIIQKEELRLKAKQMQIPYEEWKYNARGIDINRNFPSVSWKEKFEGDFSSSEQETKLLQQFLKTSHSIGYIDYHSRGNSIYYYRNSQTKEYNETQKKLALSLQHLTGYTLVNPSDEVEENDSGGNTVHFYSEYSSQPAITIETANEFEPFPLCNELKETILEEILMTPFIFTSLFTKQSGKAQFYSPFPRL